MRGAGIVMALCVLAGSASGQPTDSLYAFLTVVTEPVGADVSLDSMLVGQSPVEGLRLMPGRHVIRVAYPSAAEWNALSLRDTVLVAAGDTVIRRYLLGTFVRVQTVPAGAVIVAGDSAIGMTPFVLRSTEVRPWDITVRKEGYGDTTLRLQPTDQIVRIVLLPKAQLGSSSKQQVASWPHVAEPDAPWATYAAAASTIGFGIATVYLKHEANRNYDLYTSTGDPTYHDATNKYDRAAYWTLLITELSFGLLAYLLLTE